MTQLLVSVRDAAEARAALLGGADIVDVKEPRNGSLGAADPDTWSQVAAEVGGKRPLSIALGELLDWNPSRTCQLPEDLRYAKLGLAGCGELDDWPHAWLEAMHRLPSPTQPVAVAYADWRTAKAPSPEQVLRALSGKARLLLVDTFDKGAGDLFAHQSLLELERWLAAFRAAEFQVALAGSLAAASLRRARELSPDWIAVRGAVCRHGRTGTIDSRLVRQLVEELAEELAGTPAPEPSRPASDRSHGPAASVRNA